MNNILKTEGSGIGAFRIKLESNVVANQLMIMDKQEILSGIGFIQMGLLLIIIIILIKKK